MSLHELKFTIKQMARSSVVARGHQYRHIDRAARLRMRERMQHAEIPDKKIAKLIRRAVGAVNKKGYRAPDVLPAWYREDEAKAADFHRLRTHTLRKSARAHLIAYAFLRGRRAYHEIEGYSHDYPPTDAALALVLQYGADTVAEGDNRTRDQRGLELAAEFTRWMPSLTDLAERRESYRLKGLESEMQAAKPEPPPRQF